MALFSTWKKFNQLGQWKTTIAPIFSISKRGVYMYLDYFTNKKKEKNVLMIDNSYRFWCNMLFEKCVRIFKWSDLPFKQKEIEMRLIMYGYCGFVNDANKGFMIANGGMSGVTEYFDEFTKFTYSAPTAKGGTVDINSECVIIDNTSLRNSLYPMIQRYASLLAHADISTKMALINLRDTNTYSAKDEGTADSIKKMQEQRYKGVDGVIIDSDIINKESVINLTPSMGTNHGVMDCIDARNEILRSFFNEIGVKYSRDKKERMVESEVECDNQMLLFNINDMLRCRKDACEEINKLFGIKVEVELSPEFNIIENNSEVDDNEN